MSGRNETGLNNSLAYGGAGGSKVVGENKCVVVNGRSHINPVGSMARRVHLHIM